MCWVIVTGIHWRGLGQRNEEDSCKCHCWTECQAHKLFQHKNSKKGDKKAWNFRTSCKYKITHNREIWYWSHATWTVEQWKTVIWSEKSCLIEAFFWPILCWTNTDPRIWSRLLAAKTKTWRVLGHNLGSNIVVFHGPMITLQGHITGILAVMCGKIIVTSRQWCDNFDKSQFLPWHNVWS